MDLLEKIFSKTDNTIKYIFQLENKMIVEFSYINKNDEKDIICVPCQTSCALGCKFCHLTDLKDKLITKNVNRFDIDEGVDYIYGDLNLGENDNTLLISFMGAGEPMYNYNNIIKSMQDIRYFCEDCDKKVRFALATSLPKNNWSEFFEFTKLVKKYYLDVKVHLSLHYVIDEIRKEWMPNSLEIVPSLNALEFYQQVTSNNVEIHYALIDGVNDRYSDALELARLLKGKTIPVKFLFFNEKDSLDCKKATHEKLNLFNNTLDIDDIDHEYYIPPGIDIGASCGQFSMDYYLKYNSK